MRSWSSVTPGRALRGVDVQAQPALRVGPGDARAVEVLLDPQRVGERDPGRVLGCLRDHVVVHRGGLGAQRPPRSATTAGRWIRPRAEERHRDQPAAARCRRSSRPPGAGRSGRRRRRRRPASGATAATSDQVREARQQHAREARRRGRRRRSAARCSATPSASVSTMNAGHSQAPRIRQRMRVSQTDCSCRSTLTRYPWARPRGDPAPGARRGAPAGGSRRRRLRKGNTPHGD